VRGEKREVRGGALPRFRLRQAYGAIPRPRDEADSVGTVECRPPAAAHARQRKRRRKGRLVAAPKGQ